MRGDSSVGNFVMTRNGGKQECRKPFVRDGLRSGLHQQKGCAKSAGNDKIEFGEATDELLSASILNELHALKA